MSIQGFQRPDGTNHHMGVSDVPEWTLGDRLRRSLRHADISVGDMAADLGVSQASMARWLNDHGPVKRHVLRVWALTCGVDLTWLETGTAGQENLTGRSLLPWLDSNQQPSGYRFALVSGLRKWLARAIAPAPVPVELVEPIAAVVDLGARRRSALGRQMHRLTVAA